MTDTTTPETTPDDLYEVHELTYPGRVNPDPGSILGISRDLRIFSVVGTVYDETTNRSRVTVERDLEAERIGKLGLYERLARPAALTAVGR